MYFYTKYDLHAEPMAPCHVPLKPCELFVIIQIMNFNKQYLNISFQVSILYLSVVQKEFWTPCLASVYNVDTSLSTWLSL